MMDTGGTTLKTKVASLGKGREINVVESRLKWDEIDGGVGK